MNTPPDRDRLHAFADDRLPADERVRVAGWLADHPDSAAAVHDWRRQNAALHAAYDSVLEQAVPPHLLAPPTPLPRPLLRVAAVAGWIALGVVIGSLLRPAAPAPAGDDELATLPRRAAVAYAVYVPEVRHPVEVGADQEAGALGPTVPADLTDLELQSAQPLETGDAERGPDELLQLRRRLQHGGVDMQRHRVARSSPTRRPVRPPPCAPRRRSR